MHCFLMRPLKCTLRDDSCKCEAYLWNHMDSHSLFNYGQHENKVDKFLSSGSHLHEIFLTLSSLNISLGHKTIRTFWARVTFHTTIFSPFTLLWPHKSIEVICSSALKTKTFFYRSPGIFDEVKFWDSLEDLAELSPVQTLE